MPNELAELLKKLAEKEPERWTYGFLNGEPIVTYTHRAERTEDDCHKEWFVRITSIDFCIDIAEKLGRRIFVCYDPHMEEVSVDIYNLSYELQAHLTNLSDEEKADQRKLFEIGLIAVLRDYLKKAGNEGN